MSMRALVDSNVRDVRDVGDVYDVRWSSDVYDCLEGCDLCDPNASILNRFLRGPISKYSTLDVHPDHHVTMHHSIMTDMGQCAYLHQLECYI
jgi:hypothetical protein